LQLHTQGIHSTPLSYSQLPRKRLRVHSGEILRRDADLTIVRTDDSTMARGDHGDYDAGDGADRRECADEVRPHRPWSAGRHWVLRRGNQRKRSDWRMDPHHIPRLASRTVK